LKESKRPHPAFLLGQLLVVVGGMALVSHATNQIARDYLAIPLGVLGGLVLGRSIWELRTHWSSRRVEVAAVLYLVAFSIVSLSLDWFDARGVIPSGILVTISLLRPLASPETAGATAHRSGTVLANAAVAFLLIMAVALLWMEFGTSGDELLR
jgi:hypothetical protein